MQFLISETGTSWSWSCDCPNFLFLVSFLSLHRWANARGTHWFIPFSCPLFGNFIDSLMLKLKYRHNFQIICFIIKILTSAIYLILNNTNSSSTYTYNFKRLIFILSKFYNNKESSMAKLNSCLVFNYIDIPQYAY